jgi:hypothetical protein
MINLRTNEANFKFFKPEEAENLNRSVHLQSKAI